MAKPTHFIVHHRFHDNIACLIETLQKSDFSIKLFVILKTKTESYDLVDPIISPKSSISFIARRLFRKELLAYMPSIRAVFREYSACRPEYILLRPFVSGIGLVHFVFALWYCKRIVLYSQSPKYRKKNFKNDLFLRIVLAIPKTEWMTPSKYIEQAALDEGITPHRKIHHLQLPHKKVATKQRWFKEGVVNILLIAKFQPYKNHAVLIDALEGLDTKAYRLLIAGDYSSKDSYTTQVLKRLEEAQLNYSLLGYVDHNKISDLYLASDILILPSRYEMLGYVVNEAIAHALPVIASSAVGAKSLIVHGESGFIFKSRDSADLQRIISSILTDREQLKALSAGCLEVYKKELSPESFLKRYKTLLGQTKQ